MKNAMLAAGLVGGLVACAPPPGGYYSPLDGLRDNSLAQVRGFSEYTKLQLAKAPPEQVLEAAKKSLADTLKDPGSAQFRNVRFVEYLEGVVVCGDVNGKNSYGGYVGFRDFVASSISSHMRDTDSRYPAITDAANAGLNAACSGKTWTPPAYSS
jgi:hypothetical protein